MGMLLWKHLMVIIEDEILKMKELIIIGAGGFGREVYNLAIESNGYNETFVIKGFLDDNIGALDGYVGYPNILNSINSYQPQANDVFICALGPVKAKLKCSQLLLSRGGCFISLVHKDAYISKNTSYGIGCIICKNTHISCDVKIGDFVSLQPFVDLGHDTTVGDWCHINTYAFCGGYARVGNRVTLHTSSIVLPHAVVEDDATVAVGSVVLRRVKQGKTVFGNPAKELPLPNSK